MSRLRMFIVAVALSVFLATSTNGAIVNGNCYLEGNVNHSLTKAEIDYSALHEPKYTDGDGFYQWLAVLPGNHTFSYSHVGYFPETQVYYVPMFGTELPPITLETKALCNPPSWEYYPYNPPGTTITFPYDEGRHNPTSTYRVEWWYVNLHVTDEDGDEYGGCVAFFKPPVIGFPGMVLSSIISLDQGTPYDHAEFPLVFSADEQKLDISAGGNWWYNRESGGYLRPFEYHLYSGWIDDGIVALDIDMKSLKPPIPIGGDGFIEFTDEIWSYYYSHPNVDVLGTLRLPGFDSKKDIHGYAWIDHQWANFPEETVSWEWLSIQLDDMREIMVADVWVDDILQGSFSGGLNYYDDEGNLEILEDYSLTPTDWWLDSVTEKMFPIKWRVREEIHGIDLTVTALFDNQVMRIGENQILPLCFWEGACSVSGTIAGEEVSGTAYAEVTHPATFQLGISHLVAGETGQFTVTGARPNTMTYLGYSLKGPGDTYVPFLDVTLGLKKPKQAGNPTVTDGDGSATWSIPIPNEAGGRTVWIQAAQEGEVSVISEAVVE